MKESLCGILRCPIDKSVLTIVDPVMRDGEIESGKLVCRDGGHEYPIVNFVPNMVTDASLFQKTESVEQWGEQWNNEQWMTSKYYGKEWLDLELREWNIPEKWFAGKRILEAGCGNGRNTLILSRFDFAECVAFDLSNSIDAMLHRKEFARVHLVRADMANPPFADGYFDLVLARQVLQHTKDPGKSIASLARMLKTGGYFVGSLYKTPEKFLTWFKLHLIGFVRWLLSFLPKKAVHYFTWFSIPCFKYKILYPIGRIFFIRSDYDDSDEFVWNLNHDQYITSFQYTFTRAETVKMFNDAGLDELVESKEWENLFRATKHRNDEC